MWMCEGDLCVIKFSGPTRAKTSVCRVTQKVLALQRSPRWIGRLELCKGCQSENWRPRQPWEWVKWWSNIFVCEDNIFVLLGLLFLRVRLIWLTNFIWQGYSRSVCDIPHANKTQVPRRVWPKKEEDFSQEFPHKNTLPRLWNKTEYILPVCDFEETVKRGIFWGVKGAWVPSI